MNKMDEILKDIADFAKSKGFVGSLIIKDGNEVVADINLERDRPKLLKNPNFSELISYTEEKLSDLEFHQDDDFEQYFFEQAMEAMYGKKFWYWYNKKI